MSMTYAPETWAIARRWFWHLRHDPMQLVAAVAQPALWLVLFGNLFAGAGVRFTGGAPDYISFMTAGVVVMTVFNSAISGGIEVLFDREQGFHDRLLAAPIHRTTLLAGRYVYILALSALQGAVILGVAMLMGVRIATGAPGAIVTLLIAVLMGIGIATLSLALAFVLKGHGAFFGIIVLINLPLVFISSALAPLDAMPLWLSALAHLNPMTYAIDGARSLIVSGWQPSALVPVAIALLLFDLVTFGLGARVYQGASD
jgi:ABC-2 type transport system permease protein